MSKTQLIQHLLNALKKRELTAEEAHKVLLLEGVLVSKRTVYRYLDTLETIDYEDGKVKSNTSENGKKSWFFEPEISRSLDNSEVITFELMRCFVPKSIYDSRKESFTKLDNNMPKLFGASGMKNLKDDTNTIFHNTGYFSAKPTNAYKDIDQILASIKGGRQIEVHLTCSGYLNVEGFPLNTALNPVKLIYHRGMFFLGLVNPKNDSIEVIGLDQMEAHSHLDGHFDAEEQRKLFSQQLTIRFGLDKPIVKGVYNIELLMSNEKAEALSSQYWHHSQVVDKGEEMSIFRFRCSINQELINWVKCRSKDVKLLGPKELSDLIPSLSIHQS